MEEKKEGRTQGRKDRRTEGRKDGRERTEGTMKSKKRTYVRRRSVSSCRPFEVGPSKPIWMWPFFWKCVNVEVEERITNEERKGVEIEERQDVSVEDINNN